MASMELKDMETVENKDFPSDLISQRHPWLIISHGKQHQKKTFFSISRDRHYPGIIPEHHLVIAIVTLSSSMEKITKLSLNFVVRVIKEFSSQTFEDFPCSLSSVAFFGGKIICSLYPESFLLTAEIVGSTLQFSDLITKEVPPFVSAPKLLSQSHLVEFSGEMLLVYRFRFISGSCWDMGFTVFKLDFSKRALEEVISIGENAIFLDEDHGICCPATD
ncbi:hypothetical protein QQP08_016744 [Theobroma cacao]|nr:hypothetical protein QQP08_016744 [Theobroma cacao]